LRIIQEKSAYVNIPGYFYLPERRISAEKMRPCFSDPERHGRIRYAVVCRVFLFSRKPPEDPVI
jgi:hypothetical protein